MGMYDSIIMRVKCPYCGEEKLHRLQTKSLACELHILSPGDYTGGYDSPIDVIFECESAPCMQYMRDNNFDDSHGRAINMKIDVYDGIISEKYYFPDL